MKRILFFYPHKFSALTDGIHSRVVSILHFLKSRGFIVDMVSFDNPAITATSFVVEHKLVHQLYLVDDNSFIQKTASTAPQKFPLLSSLAERVRRKILPASHFEKLRATEKLPDLVTDSLLQRIAWLDEKENYEAVFVVYTYWSGLIKALKKNNAAKTILDTTDFLTLQQFYYHHDIDYLRVGGLLGNEMERISAFDHCIHISHDELLFFSNFIPGTKHHFIPQFFEETTSESDAAAHIYDVLFVGSGNPFNVEGINWFLKEVYPLLGANLSIAIAGNVCDKIICELPNVMKLGFVSDAEELFRRSRITICPLKRGSGMKIKVIESLAHAVPVVSTSKGIDGFLNKKLPGAVLINDDAELFAAEIMHLVQDTDYYKKQSGISREIFQNNFSQKVNFFKLDEIFLEF